MAAAATVKPSKRVRFDNATPASTTTSPATERRPAETTTTTTSTAGESTSTDDERRFDDFGHNASSSAPHPARRRLLPNDRRAFDVREMLADSDDDTESDVDDAAAAKLWLTESTLDDLPDRVRRIVEDATPQLPFTSSADNVVPMDGELDALAQMVLRQLDDAFTRPSYCGADNVEELLIETADGVRTVTRKRLFRKSLTLRKLLERRAVDARFDGPMRLRNMYSQTLNNVLRWLEMHENDTEADDGTNGGGGGDGGDDNDDHSGKEADHVDVCGRPPSTADTNTAYFLDGVADQDYVFIRHLNSTQLAQLVRAADFFKIESLLRLACRGLADQLADDKTAADIRRILRLENDLSADEMRHIELLDEWTVPTKQHFDLKF